MLNFLSSPVLYTKSKYVSYVLTVLCLCILTASNITELYIYIYILYFVYFDTLHVLHNLLPRAPYHDESKFAILLALFELSI